ncbi:acyl-ACP--UDP-N-acetylglucosamine O-acyltransferase [Rhizobiaceae bacterium BDR2-2]|uniref:Acyl-[acyl-carrier-protein]--UDP-N-acetylglucosamine O-acyltransferase n=1 Tax=Ectorhizobium quercum TaxID=2965071 RepID=A0AAE3N0D8_9HYPH|nr:acyl-ACP--UDP-N-acetylglucosamine O-acyltransferase [Ectorhizobium quercum]MCX8997632.1 acyl-ACP--UDP-N-acetylglucosamine O-acyltransferase [Ectorhizobium quercum]
MSSFPASARIHPFAVVEDGAVLGENVVIGPFCHVGPKVVLKDGVQLLNNASVSGRTVVGEGTVIFPMAVIGGPPQAIRHDGSETTLEVGARCTIREGVTMNTGSSDGGGKTIVGSDNLFLANSHVAHDCILGNGIILSNNVMLAGHVHVDDHAILGGGSAVHQFSRIGRHAFVGGMSGAPNDVIPYGMVHGNPGYLDGLNIVGMTRSGISRETIHRVRRAYKQIFEAEGAVRANAAAIREDYADCPEVIEIIDFIATESERAICAPYRGKN